MLLFILLFVFISIGPVQLATMRYCDCGTGEMESITIEPCATLPCHFNQGDRANMSFTFVLKQDAKWAQIRSTLRRGGYFDYEIEIPDVDPYLCRDGNALTDWGKVDCPLVKDKQYTFTMSRVFPVATSFNKIFRYSKVRFLNQDGDMIACADLHLLFQNARVSKQTLGLQTAVSRSGDKLSEHKQNA